MGYPWPKAPTDDGTGATPADMQRIVGAQYMNNGILPNGGLTVEGTSSMAYHVNHGAVFMFASVVSGLGTLVPVDETTVNTAPAPSTGSRIDTIYVDGDGAVRVVQGTDTPHGITIARFTVPAGISATTDAQRSIDRSFAIPTGASLGRLATWEAPAGPGPSSSSRTTLHADRFTVPSDRLVRVDLTTTLQTTDSENGHVGLGISIDSGFDRALSCYAWNAWRTYSGTWTTELPEGAHTITVWAQQNMGTGWQMATGTTTTQMNLWDAGAAQ